MKVSRRCPPLPVPRDAYGADPTQPDAVSAAPDGRRYASLPEIAEAPRALNAWRHRDRAADLTPPPFRPVTDTQSWRPSPPRLGPLLELMLREAVDEGLLSLIRSLQPPQPMKRRARRAVGISDSRRSGMAFDDVSTASSWASGPYDVNPLPSASRMVPSRTPGKLTPLHLACTDAQVMDRLIARGADVMASTDDGLTPLHLAACTSNLGCVQLLIRAGASPWARDARGYTPLDYAARKGADDVCHVLRAAQAAARRTPRD
ncbi:Ribulose-5-phosphate 4-epimerase and related epimerases and aldolases [Pandoraea pnomenusa]|uniref:Ribulose-5-phosphate 4-epimerase and related epimerases and aldolases n=2 Tax=Pandoraea pnomenusa TaxID=93220 RepID=A0A378YU56_9BURK|nr:Ribulose-5-phosphate 4-epimerase and related epimerases and aldolases [Pandoraea pnomenusa]